MEPNFDAAVESAVKALRLGQTILYPTDTIWGIGCDATDTKAIDAIYKIKERPDSKSMIILVADERMILQYVAAPDPDVFTFLEAQTKPTTVIFEGAIHLPQNLVSSEGTIAIRVVQDPFCRHLIRRLRKPIVSTSANISGAPSPQTFSDITPEIIERVDHVVAWRQQESVPAQPSKIVKWNNGAPPTIIRH